VGDRGAVESVWTRRVPGLVEHRACPRVEDGETAQPRAAIAGVSGQSLHRGRRAAHEDAVDGSLVSEGQRAQLLRQCAGDQVVRTGYELRALGLDPPVGVRPLTLRAVPIAAGVIAIDRSSPAVETVSC